MIKFIKLKTPVWPSARLGKPLPIKGFQRGMVFAFKLWERKNLRGIFNCHKSLWPKSGVAIIDNWGKNKGLKKTNKIIINISETIITCFIFIWLNMFIFGIHLNIPLVKELIEMKSENSSLKKPYG